MEVKFSKPVRLVSEGRPPLPLPSTKTNYQITSPIEVCPSNPVRLVRVSLLNKGGYKHAPY